MGGTNCCGYESTLLKIGFRGKRMMQKKKKKKNQRKVSYEEQEEHDKGSCASAEWMQFAFYVPEMHDTIMVAIPYSAYINVGAYCLLLMPISSTQPLQCP